MTDERNGLIFISIASYRDAQLLPTVQDLLLKAHAPELLRFGICWQHDASDPPLPFEGDEQFRVLDVDWRESRGACWARAEIMKLWQGEQFFLQVDSHCRFALGWDTMLLRMMTETGSPRPVLSTYAYPFTPLNSELPGAEDLSGEAQLMAVETFTGEGIPQLKPLAIPDLAGRTRPMAARFLAAGFLFAPGSFVQDVPYDPELYFFGEEISMTIRAFTAGYDLFHPVQQVVWHDYIRAYAIRHWEDHDVPAVEEDPTRLAGFQLLDQISRRKIVALMHPGTGDPEALGSFGLGPLRSLADYEQYAGLSFQHRKMQDYTRYALEPPNPPAPPDWPERIHTWLIRVVIEADALPTTAFGEPGFWVVALQDSQGREIYRKDWTRGELADIVDPAIRNVLLCQMESGIVPSTWSVWPFSRAWGWLQKITGPLSDDDFTIVLD